jgi:DNA-binding transcriptional regulator GbsR (MarR family)
LSHLFLVKISKATVSSRLNMLSSIQLVARKHKKGTYY